MAERYAVKDGNWSDPTVWDGGTLPSASDVVRANGFTVSVDQDVEVAELRVDPSAPAVVGGTFRPIVDVTIKADVPYQDIAGAVTFSTINHTNGVSLIVDGSLVGGRRNRALRMSGDARNLVVTGNVSVDPLTSATSNGIFFASTYQGGRVEIMGDLLGGPISATHGMFINLAESAANYDPTLTYVPVEVIVHGDIFSGASARGLSADKALVHLTVYGSVRGTTALQYSSNDSAPDGSKILIYGNVIADQAGSTLVISSAFECEVEVYGSVIGREGNAIYMTESNTTLIVHGSITGGASDATHGVKNDAGSSIEIYGSAVGGSFATGHGVLNQGSGTVRLRGQDIQNPSGALGISNTGSGEVVVGDLETPEFPAKTLPKVERFVADAGESSSISWVFTDDLGNAIEKSAMVDIVATIQDKATGVIINSRDEQDILGDNGGLLYSTGLFTLSLSPEDNEMVRPEALYAGESEEHVLKIRWRWVSSTGEIRVGKHSFELYVRQSSLHFA